MYPHDPLLRVAEERHRALVEEAERRRLVRAVMATETEPRRRPLVARLRLALRGIPAHLRPGAAARPRLVKTDEDHHSRGAA